MNEAILYGVVCAIFGVVFVDSGKRCYVVCSEWVRRGVTPSFVLNYIDEGIEKYGY